MALPTNDELREAVRAFLRGCPQKRASSDQVAEALMRQFKVSAKDAAQRVAHRLRPEGESVWRLQLRRVKHDLTKGGDLRPSADVGRGVWQLA